MFMRMLYDDRLAQAAYLIGCQQTGDAIVIDPQRDVDQYLALAAENGLRIAAVAETHIHADFVSGAREMAERIGAHVYVSGEGGPEWSSEWLDQPAGGMPFESTRLSDGDTFTIGQIEFAVLHTPGHTPEHIVYLITDHGGGADAPIGMAAGDFVFVGDLGRPDLLETAAGQVGDMASSARRLFSTIQKLETIPEFVQVWPAHGAGSACGKALGAVPSSTIGYERRFNPALRAATTEASFVEFILQGQPEPPMYFATMKHVNRVGPAVLGTLPDPPQLDRAELSAIDTRAVAVVDTRPWDQFRDGHLPGALSFPLTRSFNTDVGSMVRADEDIVLIVDDAARNDAIRALIRIGLDHVVGWCTPDALPALGASALTHINEVDVHAASALLEQPGVCSLDVRRATEFADGHVPEATNVAHTRLAGRLDDVPHGARLVINCRSGIRSARASAYLQRSGYDVVNVRGGFLAWQDADLPVAGAPVAS